MRVGFDLDGTIDADPDNFGYLMRALRSAGHRVYVMTGAEAKAVTPEKVQQKRRYLKQLGCGGAYDVLVVFADPIAKRKAAFCQKHGIALLFDNSLKNARHASRFATVLVPWNTRTS